MVQYGTVQYNTVGYSTVWYSTARYNTQVPILMYCWYWYSTAATCGVTCPQQARSAALCDQLASAKQGKCAAERDAQQAHDYYTAASAEYKEDRERFYGELNKANFAKEHAERQMHEAHVAASAMEADFVAALQLKPGKERVLLADIDSFY